METTTDEIKIVCPHCGQHLAIDASMLGTELECPTCKQSFTVPEAVPQTEEDGGVEIAHAPNRPESDEPTPPETEGTAERKSETPSETEMNAPSRMSRFQAVFKRIRLAVETAARSPFARKVLAGAKTAMRWTIARLSRLAERIDSWLAKRRGTTGADDTAGLHKRKWLMPRTCLALLVVIFCIFALGGGGGVALPLDEIAEKTAKYASRPAPSVNGKTLEFNGRLFIGSYDILLEQQSRRISFDFCSTGTTGVDRGYTSIHLFTCDAADAVFITIKDDGIFVQSRRENSDQAVKVSEPTSKWKHVEAVMKPDKTIVSVAGKQIVYPAMNGVRWASFSFTVLKPNLRMKNVKTFPGKKHGQMAKLFWEGFRKSFSNNSDEARAGNRQLLKAAEGGLAEAQFTYAGLADRFEMIDLKQNEVFQWWLKAAQQGHVTAQQKAGEAFLNGHGTTKDERKALEWLLKSAESRNPNACLLCGFLLMYGEEVPHDYGKARSLLQSALLDEKRFDESDRASLYELYADANFRADDGTRDVQLTKIYLKKALQCGSDSARNKLNELEEMGY